MQNITELTTATTPLEKIGQGFCGTVWALPSFALRSSAGVTIKRDYGGPGRSISHEHMIHEHICNLVDRLNPRDPGLYFPRCLGFLDAKAPEWEAILPLLPPVYKRCNALVSERIPPMPRSVREVLARHFHPQEHLQQIVESATNEHCLLRPYLGRRRNTTRPRRLHVFSLRNYPLHVDQMETLSLDRQIEEYARATADIIAFFHWSARVDVNDVEYVLAPSRTSDQSFTPGVLGQHPMWLLDFDCCRPMTMDEDGINQASRSFWQKDPFYPRPGSGNEKDEKLWDVLLLWFLKTSQGVLENTELVDLPPRLMERIVETRGAFSNGEAL